MTNNNKTHTNKSNNRLVEDQEETHKMMIITWGFINHKIIKQKSYIRTEKEYKRNLMIEKDKINTFLSKNSLIKKITNNNNNMGIHLFSRPRSSPQIYHQRTQNYHELNKQNNTKRKNSNKNLLKLANKLIISLKNKLKSNNMDHHIKISMTDSKSITIHKQDKKPSVQSKIYKNKEKQDKIIKYHQLIKQMLKSQIICHN